MMGIPFNRRRLFFGLSLILLITGALNAAEEKTVNLTVQPNSETAVGYGENFDGAKTLVLKLSPANGYYIQTTECIDNSGETLWYRTKSYSNMHQWQTFGVLPNFMVSGGETESHAAVFHGLLGVMEPTGGSGSLEFDVKVNEVDIDVDALGRHVDDVWSPANPETDNPELSEVEDKCESGTDGGLGIPVTDNQLMLPSTPALDSGKAMRVRVNARKGGTLVFAISGGDSDEIGIYRQQDGQQAQSRVTNGIAIDTNEHFNEVFYLHTTSNFDDAVTITAVLQCSGDTEGSAQDIVRVYPVCQNQYEVFVNQTHANDDYVPVEANGRVPITVRRYIDPAGSDASMRLVDEGLNSPILIYENKTGGSGTASKSFTLFDGEKGKTFWISGVSDAEGVGTRTLKLYDAADQCVGSVNVTVVEVTLSATAAEKIDAETGGNTKIDHFVTPKGAIPDTMTLTATLDSGGVDLTGLVDWVTSSENPLDQGKATIPRNAPRRYPVMLTVGGSELKEARAWVLWSRTDVDTTHAINETVGQEGTAITGGYTLKHTILPSTIITDTDRPALSGGNTVAPPNVPTGDTDVLNHGESLSNGVNAKWDASQHLRQRCLNPNGLQLTSNYFTTYLKYPSLGVCGNDDTATNDEVTNPYDTATQGYLTLEDSVLRTLGHSNGAVNDTVEMRVNLKSFARVQLNNNWYRIGDDFLWRVHFKFKKQIQNESVHGVDIDNDGSTDDDVPVWRNDGSDMDTNHDGFND